MSFFNVTLINGIQDISALLPLLGTEQLETHVGSALLNGFMYAAVAPISIFGCLGSVKLGLTVVIASIVRRPSFIKRNGAQWLLDAGYQICGNTAGLIGVDPPTKTYVAESKLLSLLQEKRIEDVSQLTVRRSRGHHRWDTMLVIFSTVFAAVSISPYIYVVQLQEEAVSPSPWLFPIMRASGTAVVAVFSQVIIQTRILQIVRARIIFMTISQSYPDVTDVAVNHAGCWDTQEPSERCLRSLRRMPQSRQNGDIELQPRERTWTGILGTEDDRHHSHRLRIHPADTVLLIISAVLIVIGILFSAIGYVGSFSLLQTASSPAPLVWLGVELLLCLIRIFVWAANPRRDDAPGLSFQSPTTREFTTTWALATL